MVRACHFAFSTHIFVPRANECSIAGVAEDDVVVVLGEGAGGVKRVSVQFRKAGVTTGVEPRHLEGLLHEPLRERGSELTINGKYAIDRYLRDAGAVKVHAATASIVYMSTGHTSHGSVHG